MGVPAYELSPTASNACVHVLKKSRAALKKTVGKNLEAKIWRQKSGGKNLEAKTYGLIPPFATLFWLLCSFISYNGVTVRFRPKVLKISMYVFDSHMNLLDSIFVFALFFVVVVAVVVHPSFILSFPAAQR